MDDLLDPIFLVTVSGPVFGGLGWWLGWPILFWIGVCLALLVLALNLASGVMKLPILPGIAIVAGAVILDPWFAGAGAGLLVYTAIEGVGDIIGARRSRRRN